MWLYTVSHRTLLLRSVKTGEAPTRVDLLFKGVKHISLASELEGADVHIVESAPSSMQLATDEIVYKIESSRGAGWVIATFFDWYEDSGEHDDDSHFSLPKVHWG